LFDLNYVFFFPYFDHDALMHHALDVLDVPASTTAALIFLFQQLTTMLQNNDYVLVVSTDFSRAFDTVRHQTLMQNDGRPGITRPHT